MSDVATEIKRTLSILCEPDKVTELRVLPIGDGMRGSGYYADFDRLINVVTNAEQNGSLYNFYIIPNELDPDVLIRHNGMKWGYAINAATEGHDVIRRRWLYVDIDSERISGVPATLEEKKCAHTAMLNIFEHLRDAGFPEPVVCDSGNGYWLLYRIDIETDRKNGDTDTRALIRKFIAKVSKVDHDGAKIDSLQDPNRLVRLFGTVTRKGDNPTAERPYRRSRIVSVPKEIEILDVRTINAFISSSPSSNSSNSSESTDGISTPQTGSFDVETWINEHGQGYSVKEEHDKIRYILDVCGFDESHSKTATVTQFANGAIAYHCLHETCPGHEAGTGAWQKYRAMFDEKYAKKLEVGQNSKGAPAALDTFWEDGTPVEFDEIVQNKLCEVTEDKAGNVRIKPVAGKIASYILERKHVRTFSDTKEIYQYDSFEGSPDFGLYVKGGESWINTVSEIIIGEPLTVHDINEITGHIERRTYINRSEVDEIPLKYLPLANGVLNTETETLTQFSPDAVYITKWDAKWDDSDSDLTSIDDYMLSTFENADIPAIQEYIGWIMERSMRFKKDLLFLGEGDNGKTCFENIITKVVGKRNTASVSVQEIGDDKFAAYRLYQMYMNMYDDLPKIRVRDTGNFKILTGDGTAKAEQKFKDPFYIRSFAKGIYSANDLPPVRDTSPAFFLRWIIVQMPYRFYDDGIELGENEFHKDYDTEARMTTPEMLSKWLKWMVIGLKRLQKNEKFSTSQRTEDVKDLWLMMTDNFQVFAKKNVVRDSKTYVEKDELRAAYLTWCENENVAPMEDLRKIKDTLLKVIPTVTNYRPRKEGEKDTKRPTGWAGIRFKYGITVRGDKEGSQTQLTETEPVAAFGQVGQGTCLLLNTLCEKNVHVSKLIGSSLDPRDQTATRAPIGDDQLTASEKALLVDLVADALREIENSGDELRNDELWLRVRDFVRSKLPDTWTYDSKTTVSAVGRAWKDAPVNRDDLRGMISNITGEVF